MTKIVQVVAFALAALTTLGTVASANGLASRQYADAQRSARAYDLTHLAVQRVEVVGRVQYQHVVIVAHRAA